MLVQVLDAKLNTSETVFLRNVVHQTVHKNLAFIREKRIPDALSGRKHPIIAVHFQKLPPTVRIPSFGEVPLSIQTLDGMHQGNLGVFCSLQKGSHKTITMVLLNDPDP